MTKAGRIVLATIAALVAGIAVNLLINAAMGRPPRHIGIIFVVGYLVGVLPGLLLDPIQLVIEGGTFLLVYRTLPAKRDEHQGTWIINS